MPTDPHLPQFSPSQLVEAGHKAIAKYEEGRAQGACRGNNMGARLVAVAVVEALGLEQANTELSSLREALKEIAETPIDALHRFEAARDMRAKAYMALATLLDPSPATPAAKE